MSTISPAIEIADTGAGRGRRLLVIGGRVALTLAVLLAWQVGADALGPLYLPAPRAVFARIVEIALNGVALHHTYATLRLSAIGFAIGCVAGIALPFLLRLSPRMTAAIEPYVMMSVGVPKYAMMPLFILWFGIHDAPKLVLVGVLVFYVVFIAVFAGIRNVDRRLIDMARIVGASEAAISREVIWNSLLPFFFAALKVALPRAVSAAIVGELLVGNEGLGRYIEQARQSTDTVGVFVGILYATALVLAINMILVYVDRRVQSWRPVDRDMVL
jgi:NitT/TauT family transport system permease protein